MKSQELLHLGPRDVGRLNMTAQDCENPALYNELSRLGIGFKDGHINMMAANAGYATDDLLDTLTVSSIATPIQFLQNWLPGFVQIVTDARKIDTLIGITTTGRWEDEQIVQGLIERTGSAQPYGDYNNVPFSSYNTNFETRTVVRFEEGMKIGPLEEARAAAMNVNTAGEKRAAAVLSLDIERNRVGFFGFNNGANRTFGYLNDPQLPAYVTVALGGSGSSEWSTKTYLEIVSDLLTAFSSLRTQSGDVIDVKKDLMTLAIATASVDFLSTTSDFGESVQDWLTKNYPTTRVESAPELDGADGGENVFYLYAEKVNDMSTDDGNVWVQAVATKFQTLGIQQLTKGYEEDYTNATAGVMLKRPFGLVRFSGI